MPLKIVGAGQPRTGTNSLKCALDILGYGPCYHMYRLLEEHPEEVDYFISARDKGSAQWQKLFETHQSAVDFPVALFYQAILKEYGDAKVILTVRDSEAWYTSISETIFKAGRPSLVKVVKTLASYPFSSRIRRTMPVLAYAGAMIKSFYGPDLTNKASVIEKFEQWNREVIAQMPPEKVLIYDVKEGWGPLCEFLHVAVPETPFPDTNSTAEFKKRAGLPN